MSWKNIPENSSPEYMKTYNVMRKGDIAFEGHKSKDYEFGRFVENTLGNGIVSHIFDVYRPLHLNNSTLPFWKYYIHSEKSMRNILRKSTTSATMMRNLVKKDLYKQYLLVPSMMEQDKIGTLLSKLDETISLLQRKLDKYETLKKALLQNLFPEKKQAVPSLRFKEFSENWQQRRLGDISKFYSGGTPKVGRKDYYNGQIPFIRSAEINEKETVLHISPLGLKESAAKMVKKGTILYALYGATSGEVGLSKQKGAINQAVLAIEPLDSSVSKLFVYQYLKKEKDQIIKKYLQGGQGNLSSTIVRNLTLMFPNNLEQEKIGRLLSKLDHHLSLLQKQISTLTSLKQFLLQNIFI